MAEKVLQGKQETNGNEQFDKECERKTENKNQTSTNCIKLAIEMCSTNKTECTSH